MLKAYCVACGREDDIQTIIASIIQPDTHEVQSGQEHIIDVAFVCIAVKTLKTGKAADCDEILPEAFNA